MLPLLGSYERRVGNDLERGRFETVIQLSEPLLLAVCQETVELIARGSGMGDLVNVVVEGLRILDGGRDGVVLIVELGEEILSPHAKFPGGPL